MNRKISLGMAVTIVILAMTVTFSITMLIAMRLFDSTVNSVKEKESMYNKIAEVDRYVRSNDYYTIDEATLYAVSYTHLDVYKRQASSSTTTKSSISPTLSRTWCWTTSCPAISTLRHGNCTLPPMFPAWCSSCG